MKHTHSRLIAFSVAGLALVASLAWVGLQKQYTFSEVNGLPNPFAYRVTSLVGSLQEIGTYNGYPVKNVFFQEGETDPQELQGSTVVDTFFYLLTGTNVSAGAPFSAGLTPGAEVFGYYYSPTLEERTAVGTLAQRFSAGQFFAFGPDSTAEMQAFATQHGVTNLFDASEIDFDQNRIALLIVNSTDSSIDINGLEWCGDAIVQAPEQCDDGNDIDNDACSNQCVLNYSLVVNEGIGMPGTASTPRTSTNVLLHRHEFENPIIDTSVELVQLLYRVDIGTADDMETYAVWYDSNSDGVGDTSINAEVSFLANNQIAFSFDPTPMLPTDTPFVLEVRGNPAAWLQPGHTYRMIVGNSGLNFISARTLPSGRTLSGIAQNGVCATAPCDMNYVPGTTTTWTFQAPASSSSSSAPASSSSSSSGGAPPTSSSSSSAAPVCGNGIPEAGEECDDGNTSNTDSCTNVCEWAVCGDGFHQPDGATPDPSDDEECDDGNQNNNDSCDNQCQLLPPPIGGSSSSSAPASSSSSSSVPASSSSSSSAAGGGVAGGGGGGVGD